jgi:hypothetical protein
MMRAAALVLATLSLADARPAVHTVQGAYGGTYGAVMLHQIGERITGEYACCGHGTIDGKISNTTIEYAWSGASGTGHGVWRLDLRTGNLDGTWGWNASATDGGVWNLTLAQPGAEIAH